ncbi:MAG: hypothetical protein R3C56_02535 [Pirellulaceae bacterium]
MVIVFAGATAWGIGAALGNPIVEDTYPALTSIPKLFSTGETVIVRELAPQPAEGSAPFVPIDLPIDTDLLYQLVIHSNMTVLLADSADSANFSRAPIRILAGESLTWNRRTNKLEELAIPTDEATQLHVQNGEVYDAVLTFTAVTMPPVPEAASLVITALAVLRLDWPYCCNKRSRRARRPSCACHAQERKCAAAVPGADATWIAGHRALYIFRLIRLARISSCSKIAVSPRLCCWQLSKESGQPAARSARKLKARPLSRFYSKPIQRRSFVIGKFLGIFWLLMLMFVVLGTLELTAVAYKPIYDSRETSGSDAHLAAVPFGNDPHHSRLGDGLHAVGGVDGCQCCLGDSPAAVGQFGDLLRHLCRRQLDHIAGE